MNREIWKKRNFTNKNPLDYNCPICKIGILSITNLNSKIIPGQEEMIKYNYPHGIDYVFSGILVCKNISCKNVVAIVGSVLKDIQDVCQESNGEYVEEYFSAYYPKYFFPPLKIIEISQKVKKEVAEQLNLSFSHFFNDLSSCANRIRNSIELILDDLEAPKKYRDAKTNKLKAFRTLHHRIENYQKKTKNKKIANLLFAIKIIGNEGSHIGDITLDDVLDAYEFLESILDFVYDKKEKNIHIKASEIVMKNKPMSKNQ
ncbi:DUF4145 domain-containing protein [Flavobacterium tyrosinilyticum]|uniref:DUF4145 domain-containing protein n=1 Tax=Flavobacterium tyrosinilyticum TaxID=1658740 RepID=UPI0020305D96|nr:DUF4145 domain-containing protein [Flavobacterium tyrosinilyticum]MCM0666386.1 DUF4145 domain-containing protein [Flavobacterium tyrosinilyticum]